MVTRLAFFPLKAEIWMDSIQHLPLHKEVRMAASKLLSGCATEKEAVWLLKVLNTNDIIVKGVRGTGKNLLDVLEVIAA